MNPASIQIVLTVYLEVCETFASTLSLFKNKILFPSQTQSFRGIRFYVLLVHSNGVARGTVFLQNLLQLRFYLNICQLVQ